MFKSFLSAIMVVGSLLTVSANSYAAEPDTKQQGIELTPDLLKLLREEMREISGGVQGIVLSLATADWKSIEVVSSKIRASYIMEKKLTPSQKKKLGQALPEHFKQLDAEFHQRAEKLEMAAAAHDHELAVFHYSRLVESCVRCHSTFATKRFPGFAAQKPMKHQH